MRLLVIMLLFLPTLRLNAQYYTRDAGIRAGSFSTICYRTYSDEINYSEILLGLKRDALRATFLKEYMRPALQKFTPNICLVYGFGAHAGLSWMDHYHTLNRTYYLDDYRYSPVFGIDGYLGLEYRFPELPFIIGIDYKPFFEYSTVRFFGLYLFDSAFILKYKF
jgi:hypothetical protein